ncbi:hypothetical protein AX16_006138 [Volvariella volvacea WC 439]|nr:hypothetical protein AX16_006138 [Volvariella volvacea WC 439]
MLACNMWQPYALTTDKIYGTVSNRGSGAELEWAFLLATGPTGGRWVRIIREANGKWTVDSNDWEDPKRFADVLIFYPIGRRYSCYDSEDFRNCIEIGVEHVARHQDITTFTSQVWFTKIVQTLHNGQTFVKSTDAEGLGVSMKAQADASLASTRWPRVINVPVTYWDD